METIAGFPHEKFKRYYSPKKVTEKIVEAPLPLLTLSEQFRP